MISDKGMLIVVSGPAGAGKSTICKEFIKTAKNCVLSVSCTTRKPRPGEVEGREYYFLSKEKFEKYIQKGYFLEYAIYNDNYYGTPCNKVLEEMDNKKDIILEIEMQGAMQVMDTIDANQDKFEKAIFVFVTTPSYETLKQRLIDRGTETETEVLARLERAKIELAHSNRYNYIIINVDVDQSVEVLDSIIRAEKHSVERNNEFLEKFSKQMK